MTVSTQPGWPVGRPPLPERLLVALSKGRAIGAVALLACALWAVGAWLLFLWALGAPFGGVR